MPLRELRRAAPLTQDPEPAFYFYRLRAGGHEQTGLAACYSMDEYEQGLIKKHEFTRRDKEDDRTRHMLELGAQTGLVFLTYRAATEGIAPVKVEAITPDGQEDLLLESSAAYLRHWMDVLKADTRAVVIAAARGPEGRRLHSGDPPTGGGSPAR